MDNHHDNGLDCQQPDLFQSLGLPTRSVMLKPICPVSKLLTMLISFVGDAVPFRFPFMEPLRYSHTLSWIGVNATQILLPSG